MTFTLPELGYPYDALEPHIDARTMEIHHTKHHQAYINNANNLLGGTDWEGKSACEILQQLDQIPQDVRGGIQNNVGGHCNHSFFWVTINPQGGGLPAGALATAIDSTFGSLEAFKTEFNKAATTRFGSGWAWLVIKDGKLSVISTANQDSPLSIGYKRILGLDVWEHAYYLHYQNRRPDYVNAYWNVVDWKKAGEFFDKGGI
ncbi:MAG TPA: superoxide dismutase [Candidatus Gracilibacteria bacterium]